MSDKKQSAQVKTNTTRDSVCKVGVDPIKFSDLWAAYPSKPPYVDPKTGNPPPGYSNQCAIKVSISLHKSDIAMKSFNGRGTVFIDSKKTATLASELAAWLNQQPFCGLPAKAEDVTGSEWESKIKGRTGIVFFEDYWLRTTDKKERPTGDHIDLWNKSRLTANAANNLRRFGITRLQWLPEPLNQFNFSDLASSKKILFWEVK